MGKRKYRFEQIAINCTQKKLPTEEDYAGYIGLEHLESGSLNVTRFGSQVPLKGEKLVMHKGDVLFGKRNAYLRRAAVCPHDGIFSAHGMVLQPREDVIDKSFFPLFISSDYFFDEVIRISVGSLSPTVNWKDLKDVEFDLPDLEEQKKLAEVLWSINDVIEAYRRLISTTDSLVKSKFIEMFGNLECNSKGYPVHKLSDIASYWNGLTYKPTDTSQDGEGILVLRSSNIQKGKLVFDDNVRVTCPIKEKLFVKENDILMCSRNGSATLVGKTALIQKITEPMTFGAFMMIIRSPYYSFLRTYFDMSAFKSQISTGTSTINQITGNMLNGVIVPVPDMDTIKSFDKFVQQVDKSKLIEIEEAKLYA